MTHRLDPFLVAAGGFIGAMLRYGVDAAVPGVGGTLAVNVLGSFALGALLAVVRTHRVRIFLGTGLLSSFTTYSTFAVQTTALGPTWGLANVGANYALGFAAALLGLAVGRSLQ
ncbi:CrcB family protein [Halogeometricum borinquense]|uniref:Fluoride-specific ion channel FluC n=1 Tax=Halogeometricum borinquense TaxID=60847 RepID=A0A6C0UGY8_9EURY|nr:CrcB family protein [Halogeometricum borinquense]QIB73059.1 CrcB family protein [Halogeometricum borinquense]QIQ77541.1 CrcB family protein [Halogeometricum borinquense]